ncbi:MAG TPA: trypsin-like peptidase domain-containing protein [Actinomycetota bacterium]|nr:trypsin-like peptidase domain-containing protein [Actinomycetota bacterium]
MPQPKPPRRTGAAFLVVAIVLAVVVLVVALSYAVVGGLPHRPVATSTPPSPAPPANSAALSPSAPAVVPPVAPAPSAAAPSPQAPASPPSALTAAAIAAAVDPSVVDVNSILGFQGGTAAGTGMVLTSTGAILTNNHVIDGASRISVQIAGVGRAYAATVVGTDVAEDVAVIQLQGAAGLKVAPLGDSGKVSIGDRVVSLGNALGRAGPPSVSQGFVVGLGRDITATDPTAGTAENLSGLIQTSAALQPGDSGGPLVSSAGQVIGMDTAASSRVRFNAGSGVGFAIPINHALEVAAQIRAGGGTVQSPSPAAQRGYLGVEVQQQGTPGAYVAGVVAGAPADAAGIQAGDTILAIDGTAITSSSTLTSVLSADRPGESVRVTWLDGLGGRHVASIRLAAATA